MISTAPGAIKTPAAYAVVARLNLMKNLLVISSSPVVPGEGSLFLDVKFVEGMRFYCDHWDGKVHCYLPTTLSEFAFGKRYAESELPFHLSTIDSTHSLSKDELSRYDAVLCSGDSHTSFYISDLCETIGTRLYFVIENIPEARIQMIFLDRNKSLLKRLYSTAWTLNQERKRRRAFRKADGLQANGYPALAAYRPLNSNTLLYLDNRVSEALLATDQEMETRRNRLRSGARLRLLHSGRLEPIKGSQDLIPIASRLKREGIDFELDIFGTGSLEPEIKRGIEHHGLRDRVRLHGAVDFETELVPFARANADLYLSCHRQSDPSCTYIESMGCGLAIAGYRNKMWAALCDDSKGGWSVRLGDIDGMAGLIADIAGKPNEIIQRCSAARNFARDHVFEIEFARRMSHISGEPASTL